MDKQAMLKRFAMPEEKLLFSKALDRLFLCLYKGETGFTDFLDPAKTAQFMAVIGKPQGILIRAFGGRDDCERQMIGFSTEYAPLTDDDFPIQAVEIKYNSKFCKGLEHRDFLGALIGLGVDRGKVGDILLDEGRALAFIKEDISDYICVNLERVGHVKVGAAPVATAAIPPDREQTLQKINVSSLRLDAVVSAAFRISRGKSADFITGEKIFVNWVKTVEPSKIVKEGDVITLRGHGRIKLGAVAGKTKKDRIVMDVVIY